MTQNEMDSFVQNLMGTSCFASWYWNMLDLAHGKMTRERYEYAKRSYSDSKITRGIDAVMNQKLLYFYEHPDDPDTKLYLKIARLFVPLIANNAQRPSHLEMPENKYYAHLVEFTKFIDDAKLQYDILTCVIDRVNNKLQFKEYKMNTELNVLYKSACAMRSFCDYAVRPEKYIDPKELDKIGGNKIKSVRNVRMNDLHKYMELTYLFEDYNIDHPKQRIGDIPETRMQIATAIVNLGWEQFGAIAARPRHVYYGPGDPLGDAIVEVGNNVRRGVAMAGATPEVMTLLDSVVWKEFGTESIRQKIVTNKFYPNEITGILEQVKLKIAKEKNDNQK